MRHWPAAWMLLLVLACTGVGNSDGPGVTTSALPPTTTTAAQPATTTTMARVDLSAEPLIWFTPHPAVNLPDFVKGSADYFDLFDADADWSSAAQGIQVFKIYDQIGLAREAIDDEFLQVIEGLRSRGIALAMELGALPPHPGFGPIGTNLECGEGVEGFGGVVAVETVRRIKELGGRVDLVAFDEPLAHGRFYDGDNACNWSVERVAEEVAGFVRMLREVEPNVIVGDIEPLWLGPEITADDLAVWLDAYEAAAGEPLGFIQVDVDWTGDDWPQRALAVEEVAKSHGVPFGIIYNGGDGAADDADWNQLTAERFYTYEQARGGEPDQVVLQSWHFYPTRVLPESDPSTFTGLINRYIGNRTVIESGAAGSTDGILVEGSLATTAGDAVASAKVTVEAMPLDGMGQEISLTGRVPEGADTAEIGIRINTEGAGPGPADLRIYDVGYFEGGESTNRVTDPGFQVLANFDLPGISVVPSDSGEGTMLHLTATSEEELNIGSSPFPVTPGTEYRFTTN
ncbi:MAG TPA: hypothetical protein VIH55_02855, partial [Acidimicrobiia bacterium]